MEEDLLKMGDFDIVVEWDCDGDTDEEARLGPDWTIPAWYLKGVPSSYHIDFHERLNEAVCEYLSNTTGWLVGFWEEAE